MGKCTSKTMKDYDEYVEKKYEEKMNIHLKYKDNEINQLKEEINHKNGR